MRLRWLAAGFAVTILGAFGVTYFVWQQRITEIPRVEPTPAQFTIPATSPVTTQTADPAPTTPAVSVATPPPLPKSAYIETVPFIEQAPHKNWDMTHEETCEEASATAVAAFWAGKRSLTADEQEHELQAIIAWEKDHLGVYEDTTAAETAEILRGYHKLGGRVRLVHNATLDDLRREIAAGRPVIVPAAGRLIGNRYFKTPGPIYHMTVVTGYNASQIITNDPGTRRGEDYAYPIDQFWTAVHDFVDRTDEGMARGEKVLVVVDGA